MDDLLRLAQNPDAWAALATLIAMEVVLGLDNLVFIALLTNRIDERRKGLARKLGLSLALVFRLALLASASWMVHLTTPLATVLGRAFSIRDSAIAGGRTIPRLEGDVRNPPPGRPGWRGRGRKASSATRPPLRPRPDHHDRHRLLNRQHHHGRRHDRVFSGHGHSCPRGSRGDDGRCRAVGGVHPPKPDCIDAGAELPSYDRHDADRRRFRLSYRKRLYLRGDVFFLRGRDAQRVGETKAQATDITRPR